MLPRMQVTTGKVIGGKVVVEGVPLVEGSVVTVGPDDTLLTAFQRMRLADVSQLPVLQAGSNGAQLAGVIDMHAQHGERVGVPRRQQCIDVPLAEHAQAR